MICGCGLANEIRIESIMVRYPKIIISHAHIRFEVHVWDYRISRSHNRYCGQTALSPKGDQINESLLYDLFNT